jgi:hypothetical protein
MMRLSLLTLLCWLTACSAPQVPLPATGPQTAEEVLTRALARPLPKTAQGMARLEAYLKNERRAVDLIVIVAMPDSVQMEAVSPTLDMLAVMATNGKRFVSFERGGEQCLVGEACPANMARLVPIALSPQQLAPALLGRPPVLDMAEKRLGWDPQRELYVVTLGVDAAQHQQVFISPKDFRIVGTVLYDKAERVASIEYVGGDRVPDTLRYKAKEVDVTVSLRKIDLDLPTDAEAFAPECPDGMLRQEMPCVNNQPPTVSKQKNP